MDSFKIQSTFPVNPGVIFSAWLDSRIHSEMTGSDAEIDPALNGTFDIWNGYINGKTVELVHNRKIVQHWRTTDFPAGSDYSVIEILLSAIPKGTKVTIRHYNIPAGQGKEYRNGWKRYYFKPMKEYFNTD